MTDYEVQLTLAAIILAADNTPLMTAGFNLVFDDLLRCQDFLYFFFFYKSLISLKHGVFFTKR